MIIGSCCSPTARIADLKSSLEPFTCHINYIGAYLPLCRLQVLTRIAMHIDDIPFFIGDDRRWRIGLEEHTFYQLREVDLIFPARGITRRPVKFITGPCKPLGDKGPGRIRRWFYRVDLPLPVDRSKEIGEIPDAFGRAQDQHPSGAECIVERREDPVLEFRLQVDQQVPAD